MSIKVLYIGEIVGKAGIFCIKNLLPKYKKEQEIDFVIANCEGATGGFGIGKNHAVYLHKLGIDVLTSGEKIYFKKDIVEFIEKCSFMLRPCNYPAQNPGKGWKIFTKDTFKIAVIDILGLADFNRTHLKNPFLFIDELIDKIKQNCPIIIVDFHANTTAEKYTLFHYLNGKVSAVIGSHTKVLTSDNTVMSNGTAVIADAGRTGSFMSIGGFAPEIEIGKFLTQIPERSQDSWEGLELQGVLITINDDANAQSIERIKLQCKEAVNDRDRKDSPDF